VTDLCTTKGAYLIGLDDAHVEALMAISPAYSRTLIPAGTYQGIDEDTVTVGVKATIIANEDVTEDEAYTIVSTIFENVPAITEAHAKGAELDVEYASSCGLPYHPGAAKYFAEKGIEVEAK
jgi:TRAP transporter TAXI family solute receptor